MDPIATATVLSKPLAKAFLGKLLKHLQRNDEQLKRERDELGLEWGAELRAALPQVVAYFSARIENLEARLEEAIADPQLSRVFTNFQYEAAREAIDERRKMLAHASAGLLANPDLAVERKARVERTLRELDPIDVLTLHGVNLIPRSEPRDGERLAQFLFSVPSGDILVCSGCVRAEASGGGAGAGVWTTAHVTPLGQDVLAALRSYTSNRALPFIVPGREFAPDDRSEDDARSVLRAIPGLLDYALWTVRRSSRVEFRFYQRSKPPARPSSELSFCMHDWRDWKAKLDDLARSLKGSEICIVLDIQPYLPAEGEAPYDTLHVTISGPHDLLRHLADDCEASWL